MPKFVPPAKVEIDGHVEIKVCTQGAVNLAEAIIRQARADFINGTNSNHSIGPTQVEAEIERFVKSEWFNALTFGRIEPDAVIETLKVQRDYEKWRKDHKCGSCKKDFYQCPHRAATHFTIFEKGDAFCPKKQED